MTGQRQCKVCGNHQSLKGSGRSGAKRRRRILPGDITGLSNASIRRVARRAGVKRIHRPVYEETRRVLVSFMEKIIRGAVAHTEYAQRKTVMAMDVVASLKSVHKAMYGFDL